MGEEYVYATSEDCENWIMDSIDEAVNEIVSEEPEIKVGDKISVYRGTKEVVLISQYVPNISECIDDQAYDDLGDLTDSVIPDDKVKEFDDAVKNFIDLYANINGFTPTFYRVVNIEEVEVVITSINEYDCEFEEVYVGNVR
jgi:hypothetical protein